MHVFEKPNVILASLQRKHRVFLHPASPMTTVDISKPATLAKTAFLNRSVGATMLAGACTFLNVYATQPLLPVLRQEFHGTEFQVSLTISAATMAVAIIGPLIGWAADTIGRKRDIVPYLFTQIVPTTLSVPSC